MFGIKQKIKGLRHEAKHRGDNIIFYWGKLGVGCMCVCLCVCVCFEAFVFVFVVRQKRT